MSAVVIPHLPNLTYLYRAPSSTAVIRQTADDFQVEEHLSFEPDGEGDHVFLQIRKRGLNTEDVAKRLARLAEVKSVAIGYAGLKDRSAVTSQWFSVDLSGKVEPDWAGMEDGSIQILQCIRHRKKLKRGVLKANRFAIVLRELQGDRQVIEQRLQEIAECGVPNYFGAQRFGHNESNLLRAMAMFAGEYRAKRHLRGLLLSAARSRLFNLVLAERITQGFWQVLLPGDVLNLDGTHSFFTAEEVDAELTDRLYRHDIHISGPMWGRGKLHSVSQAGEFERAVLQDNELWCKGLEEAGLEQDRRPLRVLPAELEWQFPLPNVLELKFSLPAGSYATSVLREVASLE